MRDVVIPRRGAAKSPSERDFRPWDGETRCRHLRAAPAIPSAGVLRDTTDLQTRRLGDVVAENQALAGMFDRLGLDYCMSRRAIAGCRCAELGLDAADVAAQLAAAAPAGDGGWAQLEPPALADHIVEAHHRYLHEELRLLDALADKVPNLHPRATRSSPSPPG